MQVKRNSLKTVESLVEANDSSLTHYVDGLKGVQHTLKQLTHVKAAGMRSWTENVSSEPIDVHEAKTFT